MNNRSSKAIPQKEIDLRQFKIEEDFPEEIVKTVLAPQIANRHFPSLVRLSETSHLFYRGSKELIEQKRAKKLLSLIIQAAWHKAEKICMSNPAVIFKYVTLRKDGKQKISPLRLAIKLLDTYMWNMFWEKIQDNNHYVKLFLKQARKQTKHINLEPLFNGYAEFNKYYRLYVGCHTSWEIYWGALAELGVKQVKLLPTHMLIEFCRRGNLKSDSDFNVESNHYPDLCKIGDYTEFGDFKYISIRSLAKHKLLGDFALFRYPRYSHNGPPDYYEVIIGFNPAGGDGVLIHLDNDISILERIYKLRMQDLNLIDKLAASANLKADNKALRVKK